MVYSSFVKSFFLALMITASLYALDNYNQSSEHSSKWHALTTGDAIKNPALLTRNECLTATLTLSPSSESNYLLQQSEVILPFKMHTIAVQVTSGKALDPEDISVKDNYNDSILITYPDFEHGEYSVGLSYAIQPAMKRISLGTTAKYYQYDHMRDGTQKGGALDLGIDITLIDKELIGKHTIGIRSVNLLSYNTVANDYNDQSLKLGATYTGTLLDEKLSLLFDLVVDSINADASQFATATKNSDGTFDVKSEAKSATATFLGKARYRFNRFGSSNIGVGNHYFTIGAGLNLAALRRGKDLSVTYNFNKFFVDDKEYSHTLAARVELFKTRKEDSE